MSPLDYVAERLAARRLVGGALGECTYWAQTLAVLRERFAPQQLASGQSPSACLSTALLALLDAWQSDEARWTAIHALRALASHLEAGGEAPPVWDSLSFVEQETRADD